MNKQWIISIIDFIVNRCFLNVDVPFTGQSRVLSMTSFIKGMLTLGDPYHLTSVDGSKSVGFMHSVLTDRTLAPNSNTIMCKF